MRRLLFLGWLTIGIAAHATPASNANEASFMPQITPLASPAGPGSMGGSLSNGPDGTVYFSWLEPVRLKSTGGADETYALKFAKLDAGAHRWSAAHPIAQGPDWLINWADFPSLAVQAHGRLTAVWSVNNPALAGGHAATADHAAAGHQHDGPGYRAWISQSTDDGVTWSAPQPLSPESDSVEFVSLLPLANGSLLAAWLDGRGKKSGDSQTKQLWSRLIDRTGPDRLVDASVCDCCQTSLTGFPDGSALLAYRGRTSEEIRDILTARFIDGNWETTRNRSRDNWKILGCPVNGPQIASDGARSGTAWFTAAGDEPRVLVSISPDAGGIYTMAQRADLGHPVGRVGTLVLHDGAQLVTWLEGPGDDASEPGGIYLRRYARTGTTLPPARIAAASAAKTSGFPRIARVRDSDGSAVEFVLAFTQAGESAGVETRLVTLPGPDELAAAESVCDCAAGNEELAGSPLRGKVLSMTPDSGLVRIQFNAVPGLLRPGQRDFKAAPDLLTALQPGQDLLARIEQRGGEWWILEARASSPIQR
jgi:hypothetical protein